MEKKLVGLKLLLLLVRGENKDFSFCNHQAISRSILVVANLRVSLRNMLCSVKAIGVARVYSDNLYLVGKNSIGKLWKRKQISKKSI